MRADGPRLIGNVAIEVELEPGEPAGAGRVREPRRPDPPRAGAQPLGRVLEGHGNNGRDGYEGVRRGNVIGTYLHGPLLPKNAWFADWLIAAALGTEQPLTPLDDALEDAAHAEARRAAGSERHRVRCAVARSDRRSGSVMPQLCGLLRARRRLAAAPAGRGAGGDARSGGDPVRRRSSTHHAPRTTSADDRPALPGTGKPPVTIGDKNYTEQFVLGELYYQALSAQGFKVDAQPQHRADRGDDPGARRAGGWRCIPSTCRPGTRRSPATARGSDALRAYQAGQRYALAHGLELLDADAVQRHRTRSASRSTTPPSTGCGRSRDLRQVARRLTLGGPPSSSRARPACRRSSSAYGFVPAAFKPLDDRRPVPGARPAGPCRPRRSTPPTPSSRPATTGCCATREHVFGWGNVVPVVSRKALDAEGPAFAATINRVSALLTLADDAPAQRGRRVSHQDPATVAQQFLQADGWILPVQARLDRRVRVAARRLSRR